MTLNTSTSDYKGGGRKREKEAKKENQKIKTRSEALTRLGMTKNWDPLHTEPDSTLPITTVPMSCEHTI